MSDSLPTRRGRRSTTALQPEAEAQERAAAAAIGVSWTDETFEEISTRTIEIIPPEVSAAAARTASAETERDAADVDAADVDDDPLAPDLTIETPDAPPSWYLPLPVAEPDTDSDTDAAAETAQPDLDAPAMLVPPAPLPAGMPADSDAPEPPAWSAFIDDEPAATPTSPPVETPITPPAGDSTAEILSARTEQESHTESTSGTESAIGPIIGGLALALLAIPLSGALAFLLSGLGALAAAIGFIAVWVAIGLYLLVTRSRPTTGSALGLAAVSVIAGIAVVVGVVAGEVAGDLGLGLGEAMTSSRLWSTVGTDLTSASYWSEHAVVITVAAGSALVAALVAYLVLRKRPQA